MVSLAGAFCYPITSKSSSRKRESSFVRTIKHCVEVWAHRGQYNSMSVYGFAANVEDDITQLYTHCDMRACVEYTHAYMCGVGGGVRVTASRSRDVRIKNRREAKRRERKRKKGK